MKMTKILLTAALLVSARAFAGEPVATAAVTAAAAPAKTSLLQSAYGALTRGTNAVKVRALAAWGKVPNLVPGAVATRLAACYTWALGKGARVSTWVGGHIPAQARVVFNSRNLKIAGAATAALATAAACWHFLSKNTGTKATAK
jgi:hypothetical protein